MSETTHSSSISPDKSLKPLTIQARGYGAVDAKADLGPITFARREPRPSDVQIQILYCGVCHSDLHQARNEWHEVAPTVYPCVPGHEIVGRVVKVGSAVKAFKEGDLAAVGCMVGSCGECETCKAGLEQYCQKYPTYTYNSPDQISGGVTYGGYSDGIVVDQHFALRVPKSLELEGVAPLLCAGITTYSPLRHWKVGKGQKVGIVGLGGLGHMGLKFSHALGARTVLLTTSASKAEDARRLGADDVIVTRNADELQKHAGSFDFILDTASAEHDLNQYLQLLRVDGTMVLVGAPPKPRVVARELGVSARTLQRRLTDEAVTFQQLVAEARRELAHHYLRETQLELNETALPPRLRRRQLVLPRLPAMGRHDARRMASPSVHSTRSARRYVTRCR